jgi:hypothetical protein
MLASALTFKAYDGTAVNVACPFMALLSFRGINTPSLAAQGELRRLSLFNIRLGNSHLAVWARLDHHISEGSDIEAMHYNRFTTGGYSCLNVVGGI